MTLYAEFSPDEQRLLRASLLAAAAAISAASPGRKEETASEGVAAAELILASRAAYLDNPLVGSVIQALEDRARGEEDFPDYVTVASAPEAGEWAMSTLHAVAGLIEAKATPQEAAGYRDWLMSIARAAAQAGKEDQGFLGFGGVMVNDAELAALQQVAVVLGVEP